MQRISITNPQNVIDGTAKKYYFKLRNTGGPKGDKGDKGDTGATGPQGPQGNAATVSIGSTTTLPVGYDATVENVGSIYNAVLDFGIPQGPRGPQGAKGDKGDTGAQGETGPRGPQGERGTNATVYIGTTSTLAPGSQATVYNSGSDSNAVLNFGIPQGAKGDTGATGATGPAGQNFAATVVTELPATGDSSKLYLTPKAHTTTTATGNPIEATITEQAGNLERFQLDGDTIQTSYTGKNLLNPNQTWTNQTINTSGNIGLNNNTALSDFIAVQAGQSYVFSQTQLTSTDYLPNIVSYFNSSKTWIGRDQVLYLTPQTFTTPENCAYIRFGYYSANGLNPNNLWQLITNAQLEAGSTTSTYVPFVGGVASPNPDYPQPVQTVTGEQTVTINSTAYPLSLGTIELCKLGIYQDYIYKDGDSWKVHKVIGSNTFNGEETWSQSGATTDTVLAVVTNLIGAGLNYAWTGHSQAKMDKFNYNADTIVHGAFALVTNTGGKVEHARLLFDKSKVATPAAAQTWIQANRPKLYSVIYTPTDTVITDTNLIAQLEAIRTASLATGANTLTNTAERRSFELDGDLQQTGTPTPTTPATIQTVTGDQTVTVGGTNYTLSLGTLELCKLGTAQDYIYRASDGWKVHKATCKVTLNGLESGGGGTSGTGTVFLTSITDYATSNNTPYSQYCSGINNVSGVSAMTDAPNNTIAFINTSSTPRLYIKISDFGTDFTAFKSWVSTHNMDVYYVLKTATDTPIMDSTLIAQLDAIYGTNLPGDMEIGYYGYNPTNRFDKWLWLDFDNSYEQLNNPESTATLSTRSLSTSAPEQTRTLETGTLRKGGSENITGQLREPVFEPVEVKTEVEEEPEETEPEQAEIEEKNSEQVETEEKEEKEER